MGVDGDVRAFDALSQHARLADLVNLTHAVMTSAAEAHRGGRPSRRALDLAAERSLSHDDAATAFGNALDVLDRGTAEGDERSLAHALAAHALAAHRPRVGEENLAAHDLLWLAAYTPFDAIGLLDRALGDDAPRVWTAVNEALRAGLSAVLGPPPVAASPVAPSASPSPTAPPVAGVMAPAPRGPVATAVMGLTGVLFVWHAARLFGRFALAYKAPAEVALTDDGGVRVRWHVELLGRTLRDADVLVPRATLARAAREVRFSGAALYGGLFALALGSYVGVSAFVDGVRAASPTLLAAGLAIVALGLGLDFVFTCIVPSARGRTRVFFVPRRGRPLCVGDVDRARADAMLAALHHRK
ncbi:MAG TPA: hypothetical protein VH044_10115 [Polyangiaceae bacterium]|jgi:hypothetical protein|nr:hypothetical protein [Polyangiaceae bacterium]